MGADLSGAEMDGVSLVGAKLVGAAMTGTRLTGRGEPHRPNLTDLTEAVLARAVLSGVARTFARVLIVVCQKRFLCIKLCYTREHFFTKLPSEKKVNTRRLP